jgi:hypothetical protein
LEVYQHQRFEATATVLHAARQLEWPLKSQRLVTERQVREIRETREVECGWIMFRVLLPIHELQMRQIGVGARKVGGEAEEVGQLDGKTG